LAYIRPKRPQFWPIFFCFTHQPQPKNANFLGCRDDFACLKGQVGAKKRPNFKKIRPFLTGFLAKKNPVSLIK
jgi:hypothetical protein